MSRAAPAARPTKPAPRWDAPLTIALLVSGVYNVTVTVAQMRLLPSNLAAGYASSGIGRYTAVGLADGVGWSVSGVSLLSLVLAIGFAVPRLQTHRTAFWVPLAAGVVSLVLSTVFLMIAVVGDPAFAVYVSRTAH